MDTSISTEHSGGHSSPETQLEHIIQLLHRILVKTQLTTYEIEVQHGITAPQAGCLESIVLNGPLTHVELGRLVQLSTSTLTSMLNRLEAKGLITRIKALQDRRIMVAATPAGMNWDRARQRGDKDIQEGEFAALAMKERQNMIMTLERLAAFFKV